MRQPDFQEASLQLSNHIDLEELSSQFHRIVPLSVPKPLSASEASAADKGKKQDEEEEALDWSFDDVFSFEDLESNGRL